MGVTYANMLVTTQWPLKHAPHLTSLVWVCVVWRSKSSLELGALCWAGILIFISSRFFRRSFKPQLESLSFHILPNAYILITSRLTWPDYCTIIIPYLGHKLLYLSGKIVEKLIYILCKIEVCLCDLPLFPCRHFDEENKACHTCHQDTASTLIPRCTNALGVPVNWSTFLVAEPYVRHKRMEYLTLLCFGESYILPVSPYIGFSSHMRSQIFLLPHWWFFVYFHNFFWVL